jgi:hypothetical protein
MKCFLRNQTTIDSNRPMSSRSHIGIGKLGRASQSELRNLFETMLTAIDEKAADPLQVEKDSALTEMASFPQPHDVSFALIGNPKAMTHAINDVTFVPAACKNYLEMFTSSVPPGVTFECLLRINPRSR